MKRLLHSEHEGYTPEADDFVKEVHEVLVPLVKKWVRKDYATVDLRIILFDQIDAAILFERAYRNMNKRIVRMDNAY
jgi:hypothetical protein